MNASTLQKSLPPEAAKQFESKGYYIVRGLFDGKEIATARAWLYAKDLKSLAKTWTEQEPGVDLAVYSVIHQGNDPLAQITNNPKMLGVAAELVNNPVYVWASKINMKAAWNGTAEYYHQDFEYWKDRGYKKDLMLSCMVFMEPHSFANAGLCVIPGSHKAGYIDHAPFININGLNKSMVPAHTMDQLYKENGFETIEAKPGDVLFFHTCLVHGSAHNISPNSRMILLAILNTVGNEPTQVKKNAREFNLRRAKFEMDSALERYEYFKKKYETQLNSEELTHHHPIVDREKNSAQ